MAPRGNVQRPIAILSFLASGALVTVTTVLTRVGADALHPMQIAFFKSVFGLPLVLPLITPLKHARFNLVQKKLLILRSIASFLSICGFCYAVTILPVFSVVAIDFTTPVFAAVAAVLLFGERWNFGKALSLLLGFTGVLCATGVNDGLLSMGGVAALLSSLTGAIALLCIKELGKEIPAGHIFGHFVISVALLSIPLGIYYWRPLPTEIVPALIALGILSAGSSLFLTIALGSGELSRLAPLDFLQLVYAAAFGFLFFGESIDLTTWIGVALIGLAACITLRESRTSAGGEVLAKMSLAKRLGKR